MMKMTVVMKTIDNVKRFIDIVSEYSEDMDLVRGSYCVDAKSIMGIFSMDLTRPMTLKVNTTEQRFERLKYDLRKFVV